MTRKTRVRPTGTSSGVILPRDVLEAMNVRNGDELARVRTENGFEPVPFDPTFEEMMGVHRRGAKKYRAARAGQVADRGAALAVAPPGGRDAAPPGCAPTPAS